MIKMAHSKTLKKANKKCTKGKGNMWKKGQSSTYNPEFKVHRLAAKKKSVFGNQGQGNLTGAAFNRLVKNWNSKSLLHKEMVAVLAAVTEVLKSNGGNETETEYFGALMTTLEVVEKDEEITAVVCLLSMLAKRLNQGVLKSKCDEACDVFMKLLIKYMESDHCALLKNLINLVYHFLSAKTMHEWNKSSELKIILEFTLHHKPKVRRAALNAVRTISSGVNESSVDSSKCAKVVADFCIKKLETVKFENNATYIRDVSHIMLLIQDTIDTFSTLSIQMCCQTMFKIMTLSKAVITMNGFKSMQGLFKKGKNCSLTASLNAQIITALYDYQPNIKDSECLMHWLELMQKALCHLYMLDEKLCLTHLPNYFSFAIKCWSSENYSVMQVVGISLKTVLLACVHPENESFQELSHPHLNNNPVVKSFQMTEKALQSIQYLKAWSHILQLLTTFFELLGSHCHSEMMECLHYLGNKHDIYPSYAHDIEKTIGAAIQYMGPKVVLQAISLELDDNQSYFKKSWMLPVLRDNIKKTQLCFFAEYFMPMVARIKQTALQLENEGKVVQAKLTRVLISQIWSLLPSFCDEPTDIEQNFSEIAQTLGLLLKHEPSLRMTVLSSLRLLISKNIWEDKNFEETSAKRKNIKKISSFAKNYLPILFNLYTTEPKTSDEEKVHLAVYETCKLFLKISSAEECAVFYGKSKDMLTLSNLEVFKQHALIDLCKAMLPYINLGKIQEFYNYCKPLLTHANHTIQKKAYSVIKEICSCQSSVCQSFIETHFEDLKLLLTNGKGGLIPATRALRLMCLQAIVSQLSKDQISSIFKIIPEAVICTKDSSTKSRTAAYNLLVSIGIRLKKFKPGKSKEAMTEYMKVLLAGLAGSPHLISATILSICRVMYEFKDDFDHNLVNLLIQDMCTLVSSKSREVVEATLSFFKILFATMSTMDLAQHVEYLVKCICSICEDNQRHFRFKAKEIFTRLIRKFGYQMISKMTPDKYQKQLINIRKREARKQRVRDVSEVENTKPLNNKSNEFDDILAGSDEDLDEDDPTPVPRRHPKISAPCIEEDVEDEIVDLLDPAVNKKLITIDREENLRSKKVQSDFPVSEDGRLIIKEDDTTNKTKKENDERNAILAELGASNKKGKKRKMDDAESGDENDPSSHKNVESGIHRNPNKKPKQLRPGEEFKAKKAGGDIKKGKVEPYAYLPMNRQVLNKRKQVKHKGQFKSIVKGAKRGANRGMKKKAKVRGLKK